VLVRRETVLSWKERVNSIAAYSIKNERYAAAIRLKRDMADQLAAAPSDEQKPQGASYTLVARAMRLNASNDFRNGWIAGWVSRIPPEPTPSQTAAEAARYRWIRHRVFGHRGDNGLWSFGFPSSLELPPIGKIRQGSMAQHFDAAIDARIAEQRIYAATPQPAQASTQVAIEKCECGYPMPCSLTTPVSLCKAWKGPKP